ncbi:MAG: DUF6893 family small protein [Acidimicrobiales bacterium]
MEVLGIVFLVLIALAVLLGLIVFVIALPDISRYRRLRRM